MYTSLKAMMVLALAAGACYGGIDPGDCTLGGSTLQFCDPTGVPCETSRGLAGVCTQRPVGCQCVPSKVDVCHFAEDEGKWIEIRVSQRALKAHKQHGDCRLDDGNECTVDSCDPELGCIHEADDSLCDDDDVCNGIETCDPVAGGCVPGAPLDCNDHNECTDDVCDPETGCFLVDNNDSCDDGDGCTLNDLCFEGACVSGQPVECDPCFRCNNGSCVPLECPPSDACTSTGCDPVFNACFSETHTCPEDGDPCTDDTCDPAVGCTYPPIIPCCGNFVVEVGEDCDPPDGASCNDSCLCEALTPGGELPTWCRDMDADGFGFQGFTLQACSRQPGFVADCSDCDDLSGMVNPGETEECNGFDDNCDNIIDDVSCGQNATCFGTLGCRCDGAFLNCNLDFADGCEVDGSTESNCGNCGVVCPIGGSCIDGTCECPPGQDDCAGVCTDLSSDPSNCAICGRQCPDESPICCFSGACTNLESDRDNCGSCGFSCLDFEVCQLGACCRTFGSCFSDDDCCSGNCVFISPLAGSVCQ